MGCTSLPIFINQLQTFVVLYRDRNTSFTSVGEAQIIMRYSQQYAQILAHSARRLTLGSN